MPSREAIPGLYSTGVDSQNHPLPQGVTDPHYLVLVLGSSQPAPTFTTLANGFPIGSYWLPDNSSSDWLSPAANENDFNGGATESVGLYDYRTTFDLCGLNWKTAQISGRITADNTITAVLLNGHSVDFSSSNPEQYRTWAALLISSGFKADENTLDIIVQNAPQTAWPNNLHNPSGLMAQLQGAAKPFTDKEIKEEIQVAVDQQAREYLIAKQMNVSVEKAQLLYEYQKVVAGTATKPTIEQMEKAFGQTLDQFTKTYKRFTALSEKIDAKELRDEISKMALRTDMANKLPEGLAKYPDKAVLTYRKDKYSTVDPSKFENPIKKLYEASERKLKEFLCRFKLQVGDVKLIGKSDNLKLKAALFTYAVPSQNLLINFVVEVGAKGDLKITHALLPNVKIKEVEGGVEVEPTK